jgi:hypothetical protein
MYTSPQSDSDLEELANVRGVTFLIVGVFYNNIFSNQDNINNLIPEKRTTTVGE